MPTLSPNDIAALNAHVNIINRAGDTATRQALLHGAHLSGTFENIGNIRLCWIQPEVFLFIPHATAPFAFTRHNGERIEPRRMFTDGGSIPKLVQWYANLDPWGYAPAYLLHDWLYELHHDEIANKKKPSRTFEDTNAVLMEAITTLVTMELCPSDALANAMISIAVGSAFARSLWNAKVTASPLPPDGADV
jgi:hypothetical protein